MQTFSSSCPPKRHVGPCIRRAQVSGADESSLYVEVKSVSGDDIVCEAKNSAVLAGLLTLVHSRGPAGATAPVDMPLLADADRAAFKCGARRAVAASSQLP